jgi:nucleoside-triphosphatase THEP1
MHGRGKSKEGRSIGIVDNIGQLERMSKNWRRKVGKEFIESHINIEKGPIYRGQLT